MLKNDCARGLLRGAGNNAIASAIMRLSCPKCQTEYNVPDAALIGRSRTLRCATCMTTWKTPALPMYRDEPIVAPESANPEPDAPIDPETPDESETMDEDAAMADGDAEFGETPEPERVSTLKASREVPDAMAVQPASKRGLYISILLLVLIIVAMLLAHRPISYLWHPSQRLFNALGLH